MSDILAGLWLGLSVAATPYNLLFCFVGCLLGTLIGVLPGVGPLATLAMLLPFTFHFPPVSALIMLAGIFYGAQYGGSTTSILVNLPGEATSVVTCLDGYAMARQGRAGAALAIAALGSLFAGTVTTLVIAVAAPALGKIALLFTPPEYVALMCLGLIAAVVLAHGSVIKAVMMVLFGLFLGLVGTDVTTGETRFTFGIPQLFDGIEFVPIAMGMFGLAEIMNNLENPEDRTILHQKIERLWPTRADLRAAFPAVLRGTLLGNILGILPGGGALISSFASYSLEKKLARDPSRFGRGAIEGVAGPESANNAGSQACFIPMLSLGIPPNAVMALMVAALTIHGITPGPQVLTKQPDLFWGMVASMWIGNLILVVLNLPLIGVWVRLLRVRYAILFPAILVFCCIGSYSVNNSVVDVALMGGFGLFGYVLRKLDCEPAPLALGFVLGRMLEEQLRRTLLLSNGDPAIFITRPISAALLLLAIALLASLVAPQVRKNRAQVFRE